VQQHQLHPRLELCTDGSETFSEWAVGVSAAAEGKRQLEAVGALKINVKQTKKPESAVFWFLR